jgi:16S rRNA (uracil1498-N3)-methyltransferase
MHRCYISSTDWAAGEMLLSPEEAHHLLHVVRADPEEPVQAFDGRGHEASCRIQVSGKHRNREVRLTPEDVRYTDPPHTAIHLFQCVPKGNAMDDIVEKAVEIGVCAIHPLLSERVVARWDAGERQRRRERWHRIIISAGKQCGTPWLPGVEPVLNYDEVLGGKAACDILLAGVITGSARPLHDVMPKMRSDRPRSAGLLIGPEGDLTTLEIDLALRQGAIPVNFGHLVFRVATAALYGLSVLKYELQSA